MFGSKAKISLIIAFVFSLIPFLVSAQTYFEDDFSQGTSKWVDLWGDWGVQDGALHQDLLENNCIAVVADEFWQDDWTEYTIELRAKKLSGLEGFLIMFRLNGQPEDRGKPLRDLPPRMVGQSPNTEYWWNIGGWNNNKTAVERWINGFRIEQAAVSPHGVVQGQWYDIKIVNRLDGYTLYLDGEQMGDIEDSEAQKGRIGLGTWNTEVLFDHVIVYGPNGPTPDTTLPSAVTDLTATPGNSIDLAWTAPGDDENTGTARKYIIKYNTEEITEDNWDESFDIDNEPIPSPAGTPERMTVNLYPGVTLYFALKTQDEVPNTSAISNNPSATENLIQLYAGWNLVSVICMTIIPIDEFLPSMQQCESIWRYDASIPGWLRYIVGGPGFLNNLTHLGPGYGYWIRVTEDCTWDCSGSVAPSPSSLVVRRPPFVLYGKVNSESAPDGGMEHPASVFLRSEGIEAASYVMGSDPRYGDYYVLEIRVDDLLREGDIVQLYVNDAPTDGVPIELGGMGIARRHDIYKQAPKITRLLQNYPNPFNPETWMPYQLADDSDMRITIYDVSSRHVRTLNLGHKPAGHYITKDKAAYWDGKNEAGESISSGVYFYSIQAGEYAATRKMIVTK